MTPQTGRQVSPLLSERLLIARVVTGFLIVALLVLGAWCSAHAEPDHSTEVATAVAFSSSDIVDAVDREGPSTALIGDSGSAKIAVGACALGILCCLILASLVRSLRYLPPRAPSRRSTPSSLTRTVSNGRQRLPPLSLSQLSLSRT